MDNSTNKKEKSFIKDNIIVIIYAFTFIVLEVIAQIFLGAEPYITQFWMPLLLLFVIVSFMLSFKSFKVKGILAMVFVFLQVVLVILSNFLYESNGTAFQYEMLNQRNDAFGTLEEIPINKMLVVICVIILATFITFAVMNIVLQKKKIKKEKIIQTSRGRTSRFMAAGLSVLALISFLMTPVINGINERAQKDYHYLLYSRNGDANQMLGASTNIIYEMLKFLVANDVNTSDLSMIEDFLYGENHDQYSDTSEEYFGISEDNNLVMIMVESLDTHVFERYGVDSPETEYMFPTIKKLMKQGLNFENFRQKEKTDTAEMISLLGNYPTKNYINYDFTDNQFPYSLPNLLQETMGNNAQSSYFHHNIGSAYNRSEIMRQIGFKSFYGSEEMVKDFGLVSTYDATSNRGMGKGERTSDAHAMDVMKEEMFPTDKKFFSYWTTFTMHGFYKEERENLKTYYKKLDAYQANGYDGLFPKTNSGKDNEWRTYAASVMDFDKALEIMLEYLEGGNEEGVNLLENTTLVIFSDHNTYYNDLSRYAKADVLENKYDTELFHLPFFIYDENLNSVIDNTEKQRIGQKFVTTADVLPTICDLFGIKTWKNLYFGSSVFSDEEESIVYSRIYKYFFNDKLLFYNANNVLFKSDNYTEEDYDVFIKRARLILDKLFVIDKIYFSDYFSEIPYVSAEAFS